MKASVIDASIVAAVLFQEEYAEVARTLLGSDDSLLAPDLIYAEIGNVIWKRHGRGEINSREAAELLADVTTIPLEIIPSSYLIQSALDLALETGRTVYDCLYLALAVDVQGTLSTNDRRLVNALSRTSMKSHVAWIGERTK